MGELPSLASINVLAAIDSPPGGSITAATIAPEALPEVNWSPFEVHVRRSGALLHHICPTCWAKRQYNITIARGVGSCLFSSIARMNALL